MPYDYEWDEVAMLNVIVVEVNPENDRDEGSTTSPLHRKYEIAPEHRERRGQALASLTPK
jgi:hypothetical protein